jgi:hypothetical protein
MGDLTYNKEHDLNCARPIAWAGCRTCIIGSHHGQAISNSPALVHALQPRAAIINNGHAPGRDSSRRRCECFISSPGFSRLSEGEALLGC